MRISLQHSCLLLLLGSLATAGAAQQPAQQAPQQPAAPAAAQPAAPPAAQPAAQPAAAPSAAPEAAPAAPPAAQAVAPPAHDSVPALTPEMRHKMDSTGAAIRANRQKVVAASMDLTPAENEKFWPMYREYRDSVSAITERFYHFVARYGQQYRTLTDSQATRLLTEYLTIDQDRMALRLRYVKKFATILPPRKVMRYFQVENKLDAIMAYDIAGEIPLAK
jgi:hypothetical protein